MEIRAQVRNAGHTHEVRVATAGNEQPLSIAPKASGRGSSVNGGELLMLALATCYCNDVYREAEREGVSVSAVEVEARADFDGVGLAARNVQYRVRVASTAPPDVVAALIARTDAVAEIQNTLRKGVAVTLVTGDHDPAGSH